MAAGESRSEEDAARDPDERRGLTRLEIETAALEGRQIAGELDDSTALALLQDGEVTVVGRLTEASNASFYCVAEGRGADGIERAVSCVYKPIRGERPLYDFPDGTLACREMAAFAVSEASGWQIVPPTVMRDGPFGRGMVQLWVESDPAVDIVELVQSDLPALRRIALLDAVLNNADRKGGHLLPLAGGRIKAIDNGLSFAVEPKLRTVLWQWRGLPFDDEELAGLGRLHHAMAGGLGEELAALLTPAEVRATARRIEVLRRQGRFPMPAANRPVVPWPPL
jgi:hypothetical protein